MISRFFKSHALAFVLVASIINPLHAFDVQQLISPAKTVFVSHGIPFIKQHWLSVLITTCLLPVMYKQHCKYVALSQNQSAISQQLTLLNTTIKESHTAIKQLTTYIQIEADKLVDHLLLNINTSDEVTLQTSISNYINALHINNQQEKDFIINSVKDVACSRYKSLLKLKDITLQNVTNLHPTKIEYEAYKQNQTTLQHNYVTQDLLNTRLNLYATQVDIKQFNAPSQQDISSMVTFCKIALNDIKQEQEKFEDWMKEKKNIYDTINDFNNYKETVRLISCEQKEINEALIPLLKKLLKEEEIEQLLNITNQLHTKIINNKSSVGKE